MRKYIKSMRQQFDNNSVIFKQAKRMFHYDPSTASGRHYGICKQSKTKRQEQTSRFKDDFSSVKQTKHENNEINESSWIAKLVDGIQQHSLEDVKINGNVFKGRQSATSEVGRRNQNKQDFQSIKSEKIVINTVDEQKMPLSNIINQPHMINEHPTKKNSYNFVKKRSTQTDKSKTKHKNQNISENTLSEHQKKGKGKFSDKVSKIKRNSTQSVISKSDNNLKRGLNTKKKSLENLHVNSKNKCSLPQDRMKRSAPKLRNMDKDIETSKKKMWRYGGQEQIKMNDSLMDMQEIKCVTENKEEHKSLERDQPFVDDHCYEPLFNESYHLKSQKSNKDKQQREGCGSIRKNRNDEKSVQKHHESTEVMISPKFSSNSQLNQAIIQIPRQQIDLVTASEEKNLVDKYLKRDYYQSRIFETNGRDTKPGSRGESLIPSRRDTKKYSYQIGEKVPVYSKQELNYPSKTYENVADNHRQNYVARERVMSKRNVEVFESVHNTYQSLGLKNVNLRDKENNFENITGYSLPYERKQLRSTSIKIEPLKEMNIENKKCQNQDKNRISKTAYLQSQFDSMMVDRGNVLDSIKNNNFKSQHHKTPNIPSKYSYIALNSVSKEDQHQIKKNQTRQNSSRNSNSGSSDHMIDRLNSKLSFYISQHQLKDDNDTTECKSGEPTHRAMHLNFNELKKHCEFKR